MLADQIASVPVFFCHCSFLSRPQGARRNRAVIINDASALKVVSRKENYFGGPPDLDNTIFCRHLVQEERKRRIMENRIDKKTSRTAAMTCSIRAASFYEKDPCLKSDDWVAPRILPRFMQPLVRSGFIRRVFMTIFAPKGIYQYVLARTKYIDEVVQEAVAGGFSQVVLFGAGYDSRAVRFHTINRQTVFFEVDTELLQREKRTQFQKRKIDIPGTCRFVGVNFNHEDPAEKLIECGFRQGMHTLFVLEGLLMYLDEATVRSTFGMIRKLTGPGSRVVCDFIYKSVLRKENTLYGEKSIYEQVNKYGEAWKSGIERDEIETFFQGLEYSVRETANTDFLRKKYFNNDASYMINETHCVVLCEVK